MAAIDCCFSSLFPRFFAGEQRYQPGELVFGIFSECISQSITITIHFPHTCWNQAFAYGRSNSSGRYQAKHLNTINQLLYFYSSLQQVSDNFSLSALKDFKVSSCLLHTSDLIVLVSGSFDFYHWNLPIESFSFSIHFKLTKLPWAKDSEAFFTPFPYFIYLPYIMHFLIKRLISIIDQPLSERWCKQKPDTATASMARINKLKL